LGHRPDERTYEKAKIALKDLGINKINLLTNNPAKVSEMAKLGITVVGRVPLIIKSNRYNQKYFESKRIKFKHFFSSEVSYYFYQFHVETSDQIEEIGEFLKDKQRDPLLKICVGIYADHNTLANNAELLRLEGLFQSCDLYEGFVPILHFSFRNSSDPIKDLKSIKHLLPFVKYIQTNDLPLPDLEAIKLACRLFLADIPLHDGNFSLVEDKDFIKCISKYKAFVLLDNSKGTGVRESKEALMEKISALLKYGLNDIAIFGGFGPDDLDTYFELRRYFRINFSIDAETKLKTGGHVDLEKIKTYLVQLIRFDDPKMAGVEQTKTFLQQSKKTDWSPTVVNNKKFLVHPAVFNSGSFPSTAWFAEMVKKEVAGQKDFCEVGCGSGIESCLVALANPQMKVVATDINRFASENTKLNADNLDIGERVDVSVGDVLDGVALNNKFDTIFWALPFGFLDPGSNITLEEMQVFDPGYRSIRKFFATAKNHLKDGGRLLIGFSSDLGDSDLLEDIAAQAGIKLEVVAEKEIQEKDKVNFELIRGTYVSG
jgi:16S rRNA G1207 methylase RsmC